MGGQNSIGGSVGVWARNQVQQKSIAQRSRRPQRGIGWWPNSIGGSVGVWAKSVQGEKHRTEVAEGRLGLVVKDSLRRRPGRLGENEIQQKSLARELRGKRDIWVDISKIPPWASGHRATNLWANLARGRRVLPKEFWHSLPKSPLWPLVTSVRCFPGRQISPGTRRCHRKNFGHLPQNPPLWPL